MTVREGRIISPLPLLPGPTQFQVGYILPVTDGKAELTIAAPAAIGQLMVFVPNDQSKLTAEGLDAMGVQKLGNDTVRAFRAANLPAGQQVKISFSGISVAPAKKADAQQTSGNRGG